MGISAPWHPPNKQTNKQTNKQNPAQNFFYLVVLPALYVNCTCTQTQTHTPTHTHTHKQTNNNNKSSNNHVSCLLFHFSTPILLCNIAVLLFDIRCYRNGTSSVSL